MYFIIYIKHLLSIKHSTLLGSGDIPVIDIDMVPSLMELAFYFGAGRQYTSKEINNTLLDGDKHYEENK